jgi:integrase
MTNFYLAKPKSKQSNIMVLVHAFGWRIRKSIGISVIPAAWDQRRQRMKAGRVEYARINQLLEDLQAKANNLVLDFQIRRYRPSSQEFESELFRDDTIIKRSESIWELFENFIKTKKDRISPESLKQYNTAFSILKEIHPDLQHLSDKVLDDVSSYMLKQKYSPNYILKITGTISRFADHIGVTLKKKIAVQGKRTDSIYLDQAELARIATSEMPSKSLEAVRDIFIFACYTGLRYSDVVKFDPSFVQEISGVQCLVFFSQKTGSKSVIPIFPQTKAILDKYAGNLPRRPSGQKYNDMVKEVCKAAGIDQQIQLTKLEGDRKRPVAMPKYEAISSHTARRTFVTNMSKMGLTAKQIALMTGHTQARITDIYDRSRAEENAVSVLKIISK